MYALPPNEFAIALDLVCRSNMTIDFPLLANCRHAADANTLKILLSPKGDPVGFICWAGVNKDSLRMAERFDQFPTRPWEFKEGKIALLLAVLFVYPMNEEARTSFMEFVNSRRAIYYMKRGRKRLLIRTSRGFKFAQFT